MSSFVQFLGLVSVAVPLSSLLQFDVKDAREEMPNILCWLLCGLLRHYIITASAAACAVNPNELQSLAWPPAAKQGFQMWQQPAGWGFLPPGGGVTTLTLVIAVRHRQPRQFYVFLIPAHTAPPHSAKQA